MSQIAIESSGKHTVMYLSGRFIGSEETDALRDKLLELSKKGNLIISLKEVSYLNSTAIGVIISAQSEFIKNNFKIILSEAVGSVEKVLNLTQMSMVFNIVDNIQEAKKQLIS